MANTVKSLKDIRIESGMRQKDVSDKLGISVANYSKKENGTVKVSITEIKKLCEIFNKEQQEIFLACEFQK